MEITIRQSNGKVLRTEQETILVFGRAPDCDIQAAPEDTTISRHHFIMEISPPSIWIRDLGSLNGTMVGDLRLGNRGETRKSTIRIRGGETIVAGSARFQVDKPSTWNMPINCRVCGFECRGEAGSGEGDIATPRIYACENCRKQDRLKAMQLDPRSSVLGYKLDQKLGGIGEVWTGKSAKGEPVRIMFLLPESPITGTQLEGIMGRLRPITEVTGEGIARLLAAGQVGNGIALVYESRGIVDMEDRYDQGKMTWDGVRQIITKSLRAMAFAHRLGVVHRKLIPERIRLEKNGTPWIEGFGLIDALGPFLGSRLVNRPNSAPWVAPEQITEAGVTRPTTDVWALAAICYRALVGQPPRMVKSGDDPIAGILEGPFVPIRKRLPELPRGVGAALDKALAIDPARRFVDAEEMLVHLSQLG